MQQTTTTYTYKSEYDDTNDTYKFVFSGDDDDVPDLNVIFDENNNHITKIGDIDMSKFSTVSKPTKAHFRAQEITFLFEKPLGSSQKISNLRFKFETTKIKLPPLKKYPPTPQQVHVRSQAQVRMQQVQPPSQVHMGIRANVNLNSPSNANVHVQKANQDWFWRYCFNKPETDTYNCYYLPISVSPNEVKSKQFKDIADLFTFLKDKKVHEFFYLREKTHHKDGNRYSALDKYTMTVDLKYTLFGYQAEEYSNVTKEVISIDNAKTNTNKFRDFIQQAVYLHVDSDTKKASFHNKLPSTLPVGGRRRHSAKKITTKSKK